MVSNYKQLSPCLLDKSTVKHKSLHILLFFNPGTEIHHFILKLLFVLVKYPPPTNLHICLLPRVQYCQMEITYSNFHCEVSTPALYSGSPIFDFQAGAQVY
jgi:hypothetical protein